MVNKRILTLTVNQIMSIEKGQEGGDGGPPKHEDDPDCQPTARQAG